ncbi:MAG: HAD family phosphatase [bacterium]|nr:HAD family phosphatase [bacterium]
MAKIKSIIYDLDGTLISTLKLHRSAWLAAGKKFNIRIAKKMLSDQRGMSDEAAALMMLLKGKKQLLQQFREAKQEYAWKNIGKITLFPEAVKTINALTRKGYKVWICTSAYRFFVKKVLSLFPELKAALKNNIVWREMYKKPKPAPDPLNLTIKKMGLKKSEACYIGDAPKDYQACLNAKVKFVYFCPNAGSRDSKIPRTVPLIRNHKGIFEKILLF